MEFPPARLSGGERQRAGMARTRCPHDYPVESSTPRAFRDRSTRDWMYLRGKASVSATKIATHRSALAGVASQMTVHISRSTAMAQATFRTRDVIGSILDEARFCSYLRFSSWQVRRPSSVADDRASSGRPPGLALPALGCRWRRKGVSEGVTPREAMLVWLNVQLTVSGDFGGQPLPATGNAYKRV